MIRAGLLFLIFSVKTESRSVQESVYVSRKSRSNSVPFETGYVYSKVDSHPATLAMFGSDPTNYNSNYNSHASGSSNDPLNIPVNDDMPHRYKMDTHVVTNMNSYTATPSSSYDYEKSKAEAKYDSQYLPSKMKNDAMIEQLKSIMHYKYPGNIGSYDSTDDYHVDDDDVRSSSRATYDSWPYFYHHPYDYQSTDIDSNTERPKDKRYIGRDKDIIPVHENVDDIPSDYGAAATTRYDRDVHTDNPIFGNQPFFSFVLNDYFDKSTEDDHLHFKGLDWGKDFDHVTGHPIYDTYLKRDRRLQNSYTPVDENYFDDKSSHNYGTSKSTAGESSTEKYYDKKNQFSKHEKGDNFKENHKSDYDQTGNNYVGFKDFVDTFANKFGGEEHRKDSDYVLNKEQDKGEKRKGFRRVYHKDEYQEDNEFFDNTNHSAKSKEKGNSSYHKGGSGATIQSHAAAATGSNANAYNNAGNIENKKFENNHSGNDLSKGYDNQFKKFRDVAKSAARSNSADYVDQFKL